MKRTLLLALALASVTAPLAAQASPRLEWFKPLVGKTWRATLPNGGTDVHRFELILNGQVVRTVHSVDEGVYAGEALVHWDPEKQSVVSYYVTTGGFFTTGTLRFEDGAMLSHEVVHGNAGGIQEVKGESRLLPDGRLQVKTQQLKDGQWTPGGERLYVLDPAAKVIFKEP
jgi:hypothetical protein